MTNAPEGHTSESDRHRGDGLRKSVLEPARGLESSFRKAGPAAAASYALIGAIVLLGGLGAIGDRLFGTTPWLLFTGLMLGIIVGFYELARAVWRRSP